MLLVLLVTGCTTDDALDICWDDTPSDVCSGGRVCEDGRCILPVDPGDPAPELDVLLAEWDDVWTTVDAQYAAFEAKPALDWVAVRDAVADDLLDAETRLDAVHRMALGVAEIGDGHTYLRHPICNSLPVPPLGFSNIGACFVQSSDGIRVNQVAPGAPVDLEPGDTLVAVDGRPVDFLLADLAAQPGCTYVGSTPAMTRAGHVQSLGWREAAEETLTVERDGERLELPLATTDTPLRCDGRVPPDVDDRGAGLEWTVLDDVGYAWFPFLGSTDATGAFVAEPLQAALRETLRDATGLEGLILDLRANGGGYPAVYSDLASWLFQEQTTLFFGEDALGRRTPFTVFPDPTLQLDLPVAVLVSERSFSAADFTSGFLIQTGRARAFGQPSGGGFGSGGVATVGDYTLGVNTYFALDLDGVPLEGAPPAVDEALRPSPADLVRGRDTVLEAALTWLRSR
jgi:C-terminal processing protease CtpA/Prc